MADSNIIQINEYDDDRVFKRKCNQNFNTLAVSRASASQLNVIADNTAPAVVDKVINSIMDTLLPIGGVIITNDPNDPRLAYGEWKRIEGRFIFAADDSISVDSEGGSNTVGLTIDNMPEHSHDATVSDAGSHKHSVKIVETEESKVAEGGAASFAVSDGETGEAGSHSHDVTISSAGKGEPFDVMPPYIAKLIYQRIA